MKRQEELLKAILESKRAIANDLLDSYVLQYGYEKIIIEVLEPVLDKIGNMWSNSECSLAQGYMAGKITEDFFLRIADKQIFSLDPSVKSGIIVIGNVEDDYHSMGRKMISTFLGLSGWEVHDLGNDVLAADFVDKACEVGAGIIGVSAMMYTTAMNILKVREEIDKRGLTKDIKLAVGGAIFILRPELVLEVGGDGTAKNALKANELMKELWKKSFLKEE